jgi:L-rhamnose-H+ transport protein
VILGLLLAAVGGGLDASQALVMSLAKRWRWESIWLVWTVFACVIFPWAAVFLLLTQPSPFEVLRYVPHEVIERVVIYGAGWGVGSILFGLGVVRVGMGLGLGISISLLAANGALWPLFLSRREELLTWEAGGIYLAVVLLVVGIILCSAAAYRRKEEKPLLERESTSFAAGVIFCILCGFTSPLFNLGIDAGIAINQAAEKLGANAFAAATVPVALVFSAGFVVNAAYCVYLLLRNRSWNDYTETGTGSYWIYGAIMGLLQTAGFLIYSVATSEIEGKSTLPGVVLVWPIYTASMLLIGNLEGLLRGEWKGSDRQTFILLAAGLALLVVASSVVVGLGSYLVSTPTRL